MISLNTCTWSGPWNTLHQRTPFSCSPFGFLPGIFMFFLHPKVLWLPESWVAMYSWKKFCSTWKVLAVRMEQLLFGSFHFFPASAHICLLCTVETNYCLGFTVLKFKSFYNHRHLGRNLWSCLALPSPKEYWLFVSIVRNKQKTFLGFSMLTFSNLPLGKGVVKRE